MSSTTKPNFNTFIERLKPHQIDGLYSFIDWFKSNEQFAILAGSGGSGKTYSVIVYAEAAGIKKEDIVACAPTNSAARKLGESMGIPAQSIHKTYGLVPMTPEWTQQDQDKYHEVVSQLADDSLDHEKRKVLEKEELKLKLRSKSAASNELNFVPSAMGCIGANCRLIVGDEASMDSKQIIEWMEAYTPPNVKVLLMGDEKQLPPVDDGDNISPAFSYHQIAKFTHSVRSESGSSLHKIIEKIRDIDEPSTQVAVLEMLDDPDDVMTIGENEAVLVSGKRKRQVVEYFAQNHKPDGLAWRILAYRNSTVDIWNHASKFATGTEYFGLGDLMVARTGLSRFGQFPNFVVKDDEEVTVKDYSYKSLKILENSARLELGSFCNSIKVKTGLLGSDCFEIQKYRFDSDEFTQDIELIEQEFDRPFVEWGSRAYEHNPDIFNANYFRSYMRGIGETESPIPKGHMNDWFLKQIRVIAPKDVAKYKSACEYWSKLSMSFGKATKNPETSDTIREFMEHTMSEVLKLKLDKPKPIKDWFAVKVGGTSNLVRLKKYCAKVSQSLNNMTDDIVYPFASTIHRSQGQTIDNVLFDVRDVGTINFGSKDLLCRAIYTGVSRAAKRLIVLM